MANARAHLVTFASLETPLKDHQLATRPNILIIDDTIARKRTTTNPNVTS